MLQNVAKFPDLWLQTIGGKIVLFIHTEVQNRPLFFNFGRVEVEYFSSTSLLCREHPGLLSDPLKQALSLYPQGKSRFRSVPTPLGSCLHLDLLNFAKHLLISTGQHSVPHTGRHGRLPDSHILGNAISSPHRCWSVPEGPG